jgi:hypothetical protein
MVVTGMEDGEIAEMLGHTGFMLRRKYSGNWGGEVWYIECGCGYRCTNRRTPELAVEAGQHHLRKAVSEAKRNGGVSARRSVGRMR